MSTYCQLITDPQTTGRELHKAYHDTLYGFPIASDNKLFGRLILEINQAGLSWLTILKKEPALRTAFHNFNIHKVANLTDHDIEILLHDSSIIRNLMKINAVIHNAKVILELQATHGSFKNWLDSHHPLPLERWVKIFRNTFKFTGPEIVNEFLMSTGYLPGAHTPDCPIYNIILEQQPPWLKDSKHQ